MPDWWLGVCDHPVHAVQLVGGDPPLVAVWLTSQSVQFYDVRSGALYDSWRIVPPVDTGRESETWRLFLETLRAPNGAYLPIVDTGQMVIHTSLDGRVRLYHHSDHGLTLAIDGDQFRLKDDRIPVLAAGLDRELATVGALGADNRLYLFQQHVFVGAYDIDARLDGTAPVVLLPDAAGTVVVAAAGTVLLCDTAGQVTEHLTVPFAGRAVSCSPDGSLIALVDREQDMIRVYNGDLRLTHQHAALDVLDQAASLQLLVEYPAADAVPEALAIADDGTLVFAVDGALCRTHISALTPLPQPRALF